MKCLLLVFCILGIVFSSTESPIPDFVAGYTNVDEINNANIFYWIYGSQSQSTRDTGGPGSSSLLGDVCEIGPVTIDCGTEKEGTPSTNNFSWNKKATLWFIDQPVGTGFSYVDNPDGYVHSEQKIAQELLLVLKDVYSKYNFSKNPLWVFSESYGGKMNVYFSNFLHEAIKKKEVDVNFKGIGLGDTWVSPLDCVFSYSDFLPSTSNLDINEALKCKDYARAMEAALDSGDYGKATTLWGDQQDYISSKTMMNWYNFLLPHSYDDQNLTIYANTVMRKKFGIVPDDIIWAEGNETVFNNLADDFMKDAISEVDFLLLEGYEVLIYSGQLDVIVNVMCTLRWVYKLKWDGLKHWEGQDREVVTVKDQQTGKDLVGYKKSYKNFNFWWVNKAGHMVPQDQPQFAEKMFSEVVLGES